MKVVVEGSVRRRITKRFGPLKSERWEEERFRWESTPITSDSPKYQSVMSGFELGVEVSGDRIFVRALLRSRPFILGDANVDEGKTIQFSILSVAGLEVSGRIVYVPE